MLTVSPSNVSHSSALTVDLILVGRTYFLNLFSPKKPFHSRTPHERLYYNRVSQKLIFRSIDVVFA